MTKKDYELIAAVIQGAKVKWENVAHSHSILEDIVDNLSESFEKDNPRFNYEKFSEACGYPLPKDI